MHSSEFSWKSAIALTAAIVAATAGTAGPLEPPPGPVTSTGRFGPRTEVASLPGDATATRIISAPGSYYLSGNLTGQSGKDGIRVQAHDVTLDLNGFSLVGVPGSLDGIDLGASNRIGVANGSIVSWGGSGIRSSGLYLHVEKVQARQNTGWGLRLDGLVQVVRCAATENGAGGIEAGTHSLVTQSIATDNNGDGISVAFGSTVSDNVATANGDTGIRCLYECLVRGNNVQFNFTAIDAPSSTVIENHP